MKRLQYLKLKAEMPPVTKGAPTVSTNYRARVSGRDGAIYGTYKDGRLAIGFEDDDELRVFPYAEVEIVGDDGEVVVAPVVDITGREIRVKDTVSFAYAEAVMAVGRVVAITGTGTLRITMLSKGGKKFSTRDVFLHETEKKALRLPISGEALFAWNVCDFDSGNETSFIPDDRS